PTRGPPAVAAPRRAAVERPGGRRRPPLHRRPGRGPGGGRRRHRPVHEGGTRRGARLREGDDRGPPACAGDLSPCGGSPGRGLTRLSPSAAAHPAPPVLILTLRGHQRALTPPATPRSAGNADRLHRG